MSVPIEQVLEDMAEGGIVGSAATAYYIENCATKRRKEVYMKKKTGEGTTFQRIRRITGYLVGTLDKWNDAKKAEERDRVKHSVSRTCDTCKIRKTMECPNSGLCYSTEEKPFYRG